MAAMLAYKRPQAQSEKLNTFVVRQPSGNVGGDWLMGKIQPREISGRSWPGLQDPEKVLQCCRDFERKLCIT